MSEPIPKSLNVSEKAEEFWREPLDSAKFPPHQGTLNLIKDHCISCEFCIEFCPQDILELSNEFNSKGYHPP